MIYFTAKYGSLFKFNVYGTAESQLLVIRGLCVERQRDYVQTRQNESKLKMTPLNPFPCLTFTCVPTFILHCHADFQRHCSKVHSVKLPTSLPAGLFTQVRAAYLYSPDVATNRRETQRTVILTSSPSFLRHFNCFSFLVKLSLLIKDISSRLELVRSPQRVFLVALPPPVKPAVQKSLQENLSQRMNSLYLSV